MDKKLLVEVGLQLAASLIRSALEFARTMGVDQADLDAEFERVKQEFLANDPSKLPKFD